MNFSEGMKKNKEKMELIGTSGHLRMCPKMCGFHE